MKETALEKFFKHHLPTCAVHIYSGDRHCSCGRDEALAEIEKMKAEIKGIHEVQAVMFTEAK